MGVRKFKRYVMWSEIWVTNHEYVLLHAAAANLQSIFPPWQESWGSDRLRTARRELFRGSGSRNIAAPGVAWRPWCFYQHQIPCTNLRVSSSLLIMIFAKAAVCPPQGKLASHRISMLAIVLRVLDWLWNWTLTSCPRCNRLNADTILPDTLWWAQLIFKTLGKQHPSIRDTQNFTIIVPSNRMT